MSWQADRLARLASMIASDGTLPSTVAPGSSGPSAHPDLAAHDQLGLATDAELVTHAATAHGLASHAIDGAFHSNTGLLPTQGQKNALAGSTGTPGTGNEFVTQQDARLADARAALPHVHADADIPAAIARDAEVTAAIATHAGLPDPHPTYLTAAEGVAAFDPAGGLAAHAIAGDPHPGYATDVDLTAHALTPHGGGVSTYAPGTLTVANGAFLVMVKRLTLTTTQRATLAGSARLRIL